MNHHKKGRKFGRTKNVRNALIKSLLVSIIRDESIVTTEAKAREIRPSIEKLVTKALAGKQLATTRLIVQKIGSKTMTKKLIEEIAPRYADRKGGYTRIIKLPIRLNDGAKMAQIEFV